MAALDPSAALVYDRDGMPALVVATDEGRVRLRTAAGAVFSVPAGLITEPAPGRRTLDLAFSEYEAEPSATFHEIDERLRIDRTERETGRVRASVRTESHDEPVVAETWRETVHVERVPVGDIVSAVEAPRVVDGVTIVPVYEEVLVVEKRLVLREELHLHTRRETVPIEQAVTLRRQTVDVERLPAAGDSSTLSL